MAEQMTARLERAKEYLAIAESGDAKREAYKRAAEEIAAYKDETGESAASIAMLVGRSAETVRYLLRWRVTGYAAQTPFLMDEQATTRAADSHARRVVRERPEVIAGAIRELPALEQAKVVKGLLVNGSTPEATASVVREALSQPEVVEAIAADPAAATQLHRAGGNVADLEREASSERSRKRNPGLVRTRAYFSAMGYLGRATDNLRAALTDMRSAADLNDLTPLEREALVECVDDHGRAMDEVRAFLDAGARGFDAEVADILS